MNPSSLNTTTDKKLITLRVIHWMALFFFSLFMPISVFSILVVYFYCVSFSLSTEVLKYFISEYNIYKSSDFEVRKCNYEYG